MARGISTILTAVIFGAIGFVLGVYLAPTEGVANLKAAIEGSFKPAAPTEEGAPAEEPAAVPAEPEAPAQPDVSAAPTPETPPAEQPATAETPNAQESAPAPE
ncbi:MAG: hypothetical protein FJX45_15020, partial [Alphaproteobacteria bacterium]|nr:hypothetical protein [Alphaproteobacteria bacterium]